MPARRKVDSYKEKGDSLTAKTRKTPSSFLPPANSQRGFTLIELMVTIAIIAILAAVGMVVYSTAQKSARISKRIKDANAVQTALETYKAVNGKYPLAVPWRSECNAWGAHASNNVIPGLVPTFMAVFPSDPIMDKTNNANCYMYRSDENEYKFITYAEMNQAEYGQQPGLIDPLRDGGPFDTTTPTACNGANDGTNIGSWSVYTYGARCW